MIVKNLSQSFHPVPKSNSNKSKVKNKQKAERENKEFNLKMKIKTELKLHVMYEGWKKEDSRHSLVNKQLKNTTSNRWIKIRIKWRISGSKEIE